MFFGFLLEVFEFEVLLFEEELFGLELGEESLVGVFEVVHVGRLYFWDYLIMLITSQIK